MPNYIRIANNNISGHGYSQDPKGMSHKYYGYARGQNNLYIFQMTSSAESNKRDINSDKERERQRKREREIVNILKMIG